MFTFGFESPTSAVTESTVLSSGLRAARYVPFSECLPDGDSWPVEDIDVAGGAHILTKMVPPETSLPALLHYESMQCEDGTLDPGTANSDLVPNVYEGGFKVWECTHDLMLVMHELASTGKLPFASKSVLEAGCGAGLPAILATKLGARRILFQDFNPAVLRAVTMATCRLNGLESLIESNKISFISGDWARVSTLLLNESMDCTTEMPAREINESSKQPCHMFDIILTSETLYNVPASERLWQLVQGHLNVGGTAIIAAKAYYFGCGGSVAAFKLLIDADKRFTWRTLRTFDDGASNRRECFAVTRTQNSGSSSG